MKVLSFTVEVDVQWNQETGDTREAVLMCNGTEVWRTEGAHIPYQYEDDYAEEYCIDKIKEIFNGVS